MRCLAYKTMLVLATLLILTGCASQFHLKPEQLPTPSIWQFPRGTTAATAALPDAAFAGKLDVIWEKRAPGKPSGPLTLQHGLLAYPSVKRRIRPWRLWER